MSIKIRNFTTEVGYSDDFRKICDFLIRINQNNVITPNCLWARWVWQFGQHTDTQSHFGVAEDNERVVGLALYDHGLGDAYFCTDKDYAYLKPKLIDFAVENLSIDRNIRITLPDGDLDYQQAAIQKGFIPTTEKFSTARIDINNNAYDLPKGFTVMGCDESGFDADKYYEAIWNGFDNKRERNEFEMESARKREGFDKPYLDLSIRIMIVAPNGDYAAHCGMWCIPGSGYAYVEPVFTLPQYRKMGLGKAAVLEGVTRCGKLGAKQAYVLSSQQFYYNIGFYPILSETWWELKNNL
jgi:GNAT superfamily N-acetyltransferase